MQNKEAIYRTWARIENEVHTPQFLDRYETIEKLKTKHPEIPEEVLRHTPEQRKEYVIKTRNEIIMQELGSLHKKINEALHKEVSIEDLLGITRIILWERPDYLKDLLNKYVNDRQSETGGMK